jgi:hypothetical protein
MADRFFAEAMYEKGYIDLIPVIPPGAQLVPSRARSRRHSSARFRGGVRAMACGPASTGASTRRRSTTCGSGAFDGANIGLRADYFPGVDIDAADPRIAQIIEDAATATLGAAPVRTGRAPKRLLMYRTAEPFSRMRLWITTPAATSISSRCSGRGSSTSWPARTRRPCARTRGTARFRTLETLSEISRESGRPVPDELAELLEMAGIGTTKREGDGRPITRVAAERSGRTAGAVAGAARGGSRAHPEHERAVPRPHELPAHGLRDQSRAGAEHDDEGFDFYAELGGALGRMAQ